MSKFVRYAPRSEPSVNIGISQIYINKAACVKLHIVPSASLVAVIYANRPEKELAIYISTPPVTGGRPVIGKANSGGVHISASGLLRHLGYTSAVKSFGPTWEDIDDVGHCVVITLPKLESPHD